jgi:hypothetical protein
MSKQNLQISQISESLEVVYTAHCDKCAVDHSDNTDETDFAKKLYALGWRCNDDGDLFCPDCAKQHKIK